MVDGKGWVPGRQMRRQSTRIERGAWRELAIDTRGLRGRALLALSGMRRSEWGAGKYLDEVTTEPPTRCGAGLCWSGQEEDESRPGEEASRSNKVTGKAMGEGDGVFDFLGVDEYESDGERSNPTRQRRLSISGSMAC